jgi:hypothetical protein
LGEKGHYPAPFLAATVPALIDPGWAWSGGLVHLDHRVTPRHNCPARAGPQGLWFSIWTTTVDLHPRLLKAGPSGLGNDAGRSGEAEHCSETGGSVRPWAYSACRASSGVYGRGRIYGLRAGSRAGSSTTGVARGQDTGGQAASGTREDTGGQVPARRETPIGRHGRRGKIVRAHHCNWRVDWYLSRKRRMRSVVGAAQKWAAFYMTPPIPAVLWKSFDDCQRVCQNDMGAQM